MIIEKTTKNCAFAVMLPLLLLCSCSANIRNFQQTEQNNMQYNILKVNNNAFEVYNCSVIVQRAGLYDDNNFLWLNFNKNEDFFRKIVKTINELDINFRAEYTNGILQNEFFYGKSYSNPIKIGDYVVTISFMTKSDEEKSGIISTIVLSENKEELSEQDTIITEKLLSVITELDEVKTLNIIT